MFIHVYVDKRNDDTIHPNTQGCAKIVTPVILEALGVSEPQQTVKGDR